jgi:hypothetical protein
MVLFLSQAVGIGLGVKSKEISDRRFMSILSKEDFYQATAG